MDRDRALATVDKLYAAAIGEVEWPAALCFAADGLHADAATLEIHDVPERRLVHFESARIDTSNVAKYTREFSHNPRIAFLLRFAGGQVGLDHLFISEADMDRDPFYQELLAPEGLRYFLSAQTPLLENRTIALVSFQLPERAKGVDDSNIQLMRLLEPHVARALTLYWKRIRNRIDPGRLDRLLAGFGLTPAERRVAAALTLGEALPAYAARRRRSINTVHTHYRRLKAKLDCATQAELLARLHQLAAPSVLA